MLWAVGCTWQPWSCGVMKACWAPFGRLVGDTLLMDRYSSCNVSAANALEHPVVMIPARLFQHCLHLYTHIHNIDKLNTGDENGQLDVMVAGGNNGYLTLLITRHQCMIATIVSPLLGDSL